MSPILLALMLSLGSSVPEHNDLRIGIARVEATDARPSNPEFAITLENRGDEDFVLVLGYMLGNPKRMFPDAITLLLTDPSGRASTLHYRPPLRVGGRVDDYTVALRRHVSYVLRVSLTQYRSPYTGEGRTIPPVDGELDPKLPFGTYTIQATFDGLAARRENSDMLGIRLLNFWTGTVSSNVLSFIVTPRSVGRSLVIPFTYSTGAPLDRRGGPLFSRSEARLPAESRPLGSLESRRRSSQRHTAPG